MSDYRWIVVPDDRRHDWCDGQVLRGPAPWDGVEPPPIPTPRIALRCGVCGDTLRWRRSIAKGETIQFVVDGTGFRGPEFYCARCRRRHHAFALVAVFAVAIDWLVWWSLR